MPIPQVNERVKEAPAVMLRAVFAGVGQLLLAADRIRARAAGQAWPPDRATAPGQARSPSGWHSPDDTPNGSPLRAETTTDGHAAGHGAGHGAAAGPVATAAVPSSDVPPLPGYDHLSLPSLRARLRVLDADALHTLLAYEKSHAGRADVITMFERRLAKITAG